MAINKPSVQRIDRSNVDGIINAIFNDGCCIVTSFTDAATVEQVNAETRPYLDADKPWKVSQTQSTPITESMTQY